MSRLPSTTALSCFEAAARLGSFTRAGRELQLTQAAVSRQVIALESRLDVPLFERRPATLVLTEAGRAFLAEVRPALERIERAATNASALKGRGGRLRLSVASSLCNYWLIPRLPGFTRQHPEITMDIATRIGPADFVGGRLDASLEFGDGQRSDAASTFVMALELRPLASPAWVRLHGRRLTARTPASALIHQSTVPEAWPGWLATAGLTLAPGPSGPRHDQLSMALHAALAGLGVALLPGFMADDAVAAGKLLPLSPRSWRAPRAYHLAVPHSTPALPAVDTFARWLLAQAAEGPKLASAT
ncbi:MAG: LysR family transcriptional regulator [Rubrivivax sp.]|nr:LysR family transcriptional regulator [Rubrivivax sp.]